MRLLAVDGSPRSSPDVSYDEAFAADGSPRPHYASVLEALAEAGPDAVAAAMTRAASACGLGLGTGATARPLPVDPVPRVFTPGEWRRLEAGLIQRARLLEALLADAYADRGRRASAVLPLEVLTSSVYFEPDLVGMAAEACALGIVGFDVVRRPDGDFALLEDNVLTPGHAATSALRLLHPLEPPLPIRDVHGATVAALRGMLDGGEGVAILSDVARERSTWELRWLGATLGVPVLGYEELRVRGRRLVTRDGRPVDRLWQRTSEDRLRDDAGRLTPLGDLLLEPLRAGTVSLVNAVGCGICDDKRTLHHTPGLMRALLGEEPLLAVMSTHDLGVAAERDGALDGADALVFKPRNGAGGRGVWMPPHDMRALRQAIGSPAGGWMAQERLSLSRHPTVADGGLVPRIVDARLFAVKTRAGWQVIPGGASRYPTRAATRIVNTSQGGGVKDVWVLED